MTTSAYIQLAGISKAYRRGRQRVEIFKDLDLCFAAGEFVAVTGPSGSGKTTLLHLIGGIDRPDGGTLSVGARRIDQASERELSRWRAATVGFVFQFYNLMPMLTARQNVELPLLLGSLGAAERARRARQALELVSLGHRQTHRPGEMSGGEQQRVAIARAIVADPELILCDEPTGDLDRETAGEILAILRELNRDLGKTILMVTHDLEATAYATRAIRLDKGRLAAPEAAS